MGSRKARSWTRRLTCSSFVTSTMFLDASSAAFLSNLTFTLLCSKVGRLGKTNASNFAFCNKAPLNKNETISVFYKKQPTYNPIMKEWLPYIDKRNKKNRSVAVWWWETVQKKDILNIWTRYPNRIIKFSNSNHNRFHPTQKPVALIEYLIKTYTNEWETVLDFTMWSGTTAVACINTNRNFIWFELDKWYREIANKRIEKQKEDKWLFVD